MQVNKLGLREHALLERSIALRFRSQLSTLWTRYSRWGMGARRADANEYSLLKGIACRAGSGPLGRRRLLRRHH
jgi:hypothetical protein